MKRLLSATALAALVLAPGLAEADDVEMWVRTGIGESFNKLVEGYNAAHDDKIVVTQVPFAELVQKYATAIAGGEAPDALSLDLIYNPAFAAAGQLEDLTDWAQALPYFDELSPSHVKLGTYEGRIYGLPLSVETSVFAWEQPADPRRHRRRGAPSSTASRRSTTAPASTG